MIRVTNMTTLFKKEMLIYSFFDIQLSKPVQIVWIGYFALLLAIWGLPIVLLFGLSPISIAFAVGVPIGGASLMSKPIWGGKSFLSFFICLIKFITSSKHYYDGKAGKSLVNYEIDCEFQVNRKKDFDKLIKIKQEEAMMCAK